MSDTLGGVNMLWGTQSMIGKMLATLVQVFLSVQWKILTVAFLMLVFCFQGNVILHSPACLRHQPCPWDPFTNRYLWCISPLGPICNFYLWRRTINQTWVSAKAWIGYLFLIHQKFRGIISIPKCTFCSLPFPLSENALEFDNDVQCLIEVRNNISLSHPAFIWQVFLSIKYFVRFSCMCREMNKTLHSHPLGEICYQVKRQILINEFQNELFNYTWDKTYQVEMYDDFLSFFYFFVWWFSNVLLGGVPAIVRWVKNPTAVARVAAEARVWSPVLYSGLRIWHCHSCGVGCSCISDSVPGSGTSICHRCSHRI